ncbi:MAG TPA: ABC transporter permease [Gammaproteobacteria bacterium]|nr:ABC transporter permease [Gammaproteobacteria bacterium]
MSLRIERRPAVSRAMRMASPLLAAALTVICGGVLFAVLGRAPLPSLYEFFIVPISDVNGLAELALKAAPLLVIGMGLAIGFRANVWNIGAEGQFTMGAVCAGGVALFLPSPGWWTLPLMVLAGGLGGAIWAGIPALLKSRFNANEILTSLMLVYVASHLLQYLVHGPWQDPAGFGFPQTELFPAEAMLPTVVPGTRLNLAVVLSPLVVPLGWFVLNRLFLGFQIKVVGVAPAAASYAGFSRARAIWATLLFSGALSGLAGMAEVAGPIGQLQPIISPGYGFTAIIVAFLGRLQPLGVLFASLLMALLYLGGDQLQVSLHLPSSVANVFQGMLLFFVLATELFVRYRIRWHAPAPVEG